MLKANMTLTMLDIRANDRVTLSETPKNDATSLKTREEGLKINELPVEYNAFGAEYRTNKEFQKYKSLSADKKVMKDHAYVEKIAKVIQPIENAQEELQ